MLSAVKEGLGVDRCQPGKLAWGLLAGLGSACCLVLQLGSAAWRLVSGQLEAAGVPLAVLVAAAGPVSAVDLGRSACGWQRPAARSCNCNIGQMLTCELHV